MSVITSKTGLSSILKAYSSTQREKAKNAAMNKVRFELPKLKGLLEIVKAVCESENYQQMAEFVQYLKQIELTNDEFITIFNDARKVCSQLSPKFTNLVEGLLSQPWIKRPEEAVQVYLDFAIDLLVAHNKYSHFLLPNLIMHWIPSDNEPELWPMGTPCEQKINELAAVHRLIERIVTVIPMTFDVVLETIDSKFPYFKKSPHIIGGFVHNMILLMEYQPTFTEFIMTILLQKLVILDVNAPRSEIEDIDYADDKEEWDDEDCAEEEQNCEDEEDNLNANDDLKEETSMNHPIAHSLDICMEKIYAFIEKKNLTVQEECPEDRKQYNFQKNQFFKIMRQTFDNVLLPCHNIHHVQFVTFYFCSLKSAYAEAFLASLLSKVRDPNTSAVIRQTSVGYIGSFLARAKFLPVSVLYFYIKELCEWAHQYVERCDQYRSNGSLKANLVFFSVCQAIFYVIAFRSRILTADKKGLLYLQALRLSALVTCNFNPLRYCLPAVATAFAGVTRAHQLAYCHAVLERNARRKLATVYTNGTETAEDTLDIFFPFDPYLLKFSSGRIENIYLQYQASEAEEPNSAKEIDSNGNGLRRKRYDSEMFEADDMDDFLLADKRRKLNKNVEKENQLSYSM